MRTSFTISTLNGKGCPASAACSAQSVADPWGSASQTTTSRIPARAVAMQIVDVVFPVPPLAFTKTIVLVIVTPFGGLMLSVLVFAHETTFAFSRLLLSTT